MIELTGLDALRVSQITLAHTRLPCALIARSRNIHVPFQAKMAEKAHGYCVAMFLNQEPQHYSAHALR
jgi:hypothetical protein